MANQPLHEKIQVAARAFRQAPLQRLARERAQRVRRRAVRVGLDHRALAADGARLVLFDYVDRGGFADSPLARLPEAAHWQPIRESQLRERMTAAGWKLETVRNLDADYARWYRELLARFTARREALDAIAPAAAIEHARRFFEEVLRAIEAGVLGGAIFTAHAEA